MAATENHVHLFQEQQQEVLLEHGRQAIKRYQKSQKQRRDYEPQFSIFKLRGESFRGKKLDTVSVQTGKVKAVELLADQQEE